MKNVFERFMLFAVLSAGIAFLQQSDQPANGVSQMALQEDLGTQAAQGNDRPNQPDDQNYSSSKKHKTKMKKDKEKKIKKQDQGSSSPPDN